MSNTIAQVIDQFEHRRPVKDELEFVLYKMVCSGEIPLKDAQSIMATDWISAWKRYVPTHAYYRFTKVD